MGFDEIVGLAADVSLVNTAKNNTVVAFFSTWIVFSKIRYFFPIESRLLDRALPSLLYINTVINSIAFAIR